MEANIHGTQAFWQDQAEYCVCTQYSERKIKAIVFRKSKWQVHNNSLCKDKRDSENVLGFSLFSGWGFFFSQHFETKDI